MLRRWFVCSLSLALLVLLVTGCNLLGPALPDTEVTAEREVVRNSPPQDLSEDEYPLYVGARWVYRDATPDVNPEAHSGFPLVREVVASVHYVDPFTDVAYECFVLQINYRSGTIGQCYLHRTRDGIEIYAVETLPQTGTPNLVPCGGEEFMKLPLQKDGTVEFTLREGSSYDLLVRDRERIPFGSVSTAFGPYCTGYVDSRRIQSEYGGLFAKVLGEGIEDTWYAPGVGLARRTAESRIFELMEFRTWEEVINLGEDDAGRPYTPAVGTVVVISLRDLQGTAEQPAWELRDRSDIERAGVLSILSGFNDIEARFSDVTDTGRLDTGTSVFVFQVRTPGSESIVFSNAATGKRIEYKFGRSQPSILTEGDVTVDANASTASFSVRYCDPDGDSPGQSWVCVDPGTPQEEYVRMEFSHGKHADGYYVSPVVKLERGMHRYCFKFDEDPGSIREALDCRLSDAFDIGGPLP